MLLKLSAPDMLNTSLIDVATGDRAYNIVTVLIPATDRPTDVVDCMKSPAASSSSSHTPSPASSASFLKKSTPAPHPEDLKGEQRQTTITDATGKVVANIAWNGRRPDIEIGDEKIGALTDLFGSSTVRFMPKILAIPTRFDTEYVWTATADSLTLYDYDTETVKGSFHQNALRIPSGSKHSKPKLSSPSKFRLSSPSTHFLSSSTKSISEDVECDPKSSELGKSTFIPTHLPGVGSCYLEFSSHPLAQDIEIILSFLMMEILRRSRFSLTPYTFEKPRLWQFKEARDLFLRRLRRNTV
ncbi:hypothetical protein BDN70DRAFT_81954 [Pholiota conissans]|uniref:Uncharacterized protein n=1 Tax=Pholiota conissans TaxID=109636 RepID=A0A9P5ZCL3_9AGAR|nr:hypothetical protein BDN70DRAFT_81954 [Pholiota conissans]